MFSGLSNVSGIKPACSRLLQAFGNRYSHSHGGAHHGIVAHTQKAHHLHMGGDGAGTGELGVGVHPAHGVGHAVGSGAGGHVVRVQGAARAAAGGHGEVLLALLHALLLVGARHGVLEPGGVGGVAGDGHVHALQVHDGHALADVVRAVAAHVGTLALAVADLLDHVHLAGGVVKLGLHVGEAVDAADDLGGVLAQAVEDDPQGLLTGLVGVLDDADGALGGGEGLVARQEGEALALVAQEHGAQVAVAQAHLAVVGNRAVDAEGLEALADGGGGLGGGLHVLLQGDGRAHHVGPAGVLKADGLDALDDLIGVEALGLADLPALLDALDAVLSEDAVDLLDSSLVAFKQSHTICPPLLLVPGVNILDRSVKLAVVALGLLQGGVGVVALLDEVHHLAQVHELVADDLVVLVEGHAGAVALGHLQVAGALGMGGEHGAHLASQALAQVLQGSAHGQAALGEGGLGAAIDDLQEQLPHGGVDGVAHQVGVQGLQDGLADEDLAGHGGGVGHAGAAQGLHQGLLDDALLDVQGQLAGALLGSAPAHAVSEAGDILDLLGLDPFPFLGDGSGTMVSALGNRAHVLNFGRIDHGESSFPLI